MTIDHKAVYELREYEQAIFAAEREEQAAKVKRANSLHAYRTAVSTYAGVEIPQVEISNVACIAKGVCSHVYIIKDTQRPTSMENKCVYCGCDNFD